MGLIAIDTANAYAKALGKQVVKLKDPVEGAIPHYTKNLGFALAGKRLGATYYTRKVT